MTNHDVDIVLEVLGGLSAVVIIVWVSVVILLGAG
jgi:hypothetical protein